MHERRMGLQRTQPWERRNMIFLAIVKDRTAETLVWMLKMFVALGTIIHSDSWKTYSELIDDGYEHFTVNHNAISVDSDTGAHKFSGRNVTEV